MRELIPNARGCYQPGCVNEIETYLRRVFTETRLSGTKYGYCKACAHHAVFAGGWTWA